MIITYVPTGWEIISQRSHSLLAAQLCAEWKVGQRPARWVDTLIATAEHDDVFNELESAPLLTPSGGPMDFKMNNFDKDLSQRLIDRAEMKGSFIALLIFRHICFTHGKDPKARSFLKALAKKEKQWIATANTSKAEVDKAYEILEFCDALSLLICQKSVPPEGRVIEISKGPDGQAYQLHQKGDKLIIQPWPFEVEVLRVDYECRSLGELHYKNENSFKAALRNAKVMQITCMLSKVQEI